MINQNKNELHEAAMKFCRKGCPANYKNCARCQEVQLAKVQMIGTNSVCPLAKYAVPEQSEVSDFIKRLASLPDINDCDVLCMACEHCGVEDRGEHFILSLGHGDLDEYRNYCLDCPVGMAREHIQESSAEARMS